MLIKGVVWIILHCALTLRRSQAQTASQPGCVTVDCTVEYEDALWSKNSFGLIEAKGEIAALIPRLKGGLDFDCSNLNINYTDVHLNTTESYIKFGTKLKFFSTDPTRTVADIHSCVSGSTFMHYCILKTWDCFSDIGEHSASKFDRGSYTQLPCCRENGCPKDDCSTNPCKNGATCADVGDDFKCACTPGWMGKTCTAKDDCSPNPCKNGATCADVGDDFKCACTPGWMGKTCTAKDNCSPNPCKNGATCTAMSNDFNCACAGAWQGKVCNESKADSKCSPNPCKNGATCTDMSSDFKCACTGEWLGKACDETKAHATLIPAEVSAVVGDNVTFYCLVTGWPEPMVTWFRTNEPRLPVGALKRHFLKKRHLIIDPVEEDDSGSEYECISFNTHGKSKAYAKIDSVLAKDRCAKDPCKRGFLCINLKDGGYECNPPAETEPRTPSHSDSNGTLFLLIGLVICIVVVLTAVILWRCIFSKRATPRVSCSPNGSSTPQAECTVTFGRAREPRDQVVQSEVNRGDSYAQLIPPENPPPYASLVTVVYDEPRIYAEINEYQEIGRPSPNPSSQARSRRGNEVADSPSVVNASGFHNPK